MKQQQQQQQQVVTVLWQLIILKLTTHFGVRAELKVTTLAVSMAHWMKLSDSCFVIHGSLLSVGGGNNATVHRKCAGYVGALVMGFSSSQLPPMPPYEREIMAHFLKALINVETSMAIPVTFFKCQIVFCITVVVNTFYIQILEVRLWFYQSIHRLANRRTPSNSIILLVEEEEELFVVNRYLLELIKDIHSSGSACERGNGGITDMIIRRFVVSAKLNVGWRHSD
uniref:Uncharacterized protein n=1 Tax=Glossina pallidipes TaxID=7398 RepID=A0A1A9Z5K5_GLOPL